MSLFVVNRYLGDDAQGEEAEEARKKTILQRLHEQAEQRKKIRDSGGLDLKKATKTLECSDSDGETETAKHSKKRKKTVQNDESEIDSVTPSPRKKKKRAENEIDDTKDSVEDLIKSEKIKKKKLKKTKSKSGKLVENGSEDEQEISKESSSQKTIGKNDFGDTDIGKKVKKKEKTKKSKNVAEEADCVEEGDDTKDAPVKDTDNGAEGDAGNDEKEASDDDVEEEVQYGSHEVGGYTVLGSVKETQTQKVKRVLPDWLSKPSVVNADIRRARVPLEKVEGLSESLIEQLKKNGIVDFFPVQSDVIPAILKSCRPSYDTGLAGFRPHDICCSSPTGSGKTLAFVLPIVQALRSRVVCQIRALAVLPVRDLALQVYKVFQTYCHNTSLQVGLIVGQKTFAVEQQGLIKQGPRGPVCQKDIIIATPGRLVDHINKTPGFSLEHLRFLVIDEADRMMDEIKQDWLHHVETAFLQSNRSKENQFKTFQTPLTVQSASNMFIPPQKLLFSATLSQNPEKLQQLNLFQPKLFTSVMKSKKVGELSEVVDPREKDSSANGTTALEKVDAGKVEGEFIGKYTTPSGLSEYFLECTPGERPLLVLHFLHDLKFKQVLCFTNSIESTHRLYLLVKLFGGIEVREFSSNLHSSRRAQILKKFEAGKINLLICTDAMARGMDVDNVHYVISYEPPPYIKTYIHRIGRTARAGRPGTAFTLLEEKEIFHFKKMLKGAGKKVKKHKVTKSQLKALIPQYQKALQKLPEVLTEEKKVQKKKR